MPKVSDMVGVREYSENYTVELHRDDETGRLVIRAYNEGHNNITEVDLLDVLEWLKDNKQLAE